MDLGEAVKSDKRAQKHLQKEVVKFISNLSN
jgi:hypothetical protein